MFKLAESSRIFPAPVAPQSAPSLSNSPRPKLLVLEFWGLGDLTFATPFLRGAVERYDVTLVGKAHARALLGPTFPQIEFIDYDAPWSAHLDKYKLWKWNWAELLMLLARLRRERFDAVVSVRSDPRDHLLMWLTGARERFGFPRRGSEVFLTAPQVRSREKQHRAEDWRDLGRALGLAEVEGDGPHLEHTRYRSPRVDALLAGITQPLLCVHPGARIALRRWPEQSFRFIIEKLRQRFDFHLLLIPDLDGFGASLAPLADTVAQPIELGELLDLLGRADLLLCNDSGPCHIATACGRPVIAIFGPGDVDWFAPWGAHSKLVARDICPWRPCFDYCHFDEPHCLTKLRAEAVWPEIEAHVDRLLDAGALPAAMRGEESLSR